MMRLISPFTIGMLTDCKLLTSAVVLLDLFNFDMLVLGICGRPMQFVQVDLEWQHEHDQQVDNLEMYGVDWQDLTNQQVVESHLANNPVGSEPLTLWIWSASQA
jgi:hypothetical protein